MIDFLKKFQQRKFLVALGMIVAGLVAMFTDVEVEVAEGQVAIYMAYLPKIMGAIVAILAALGWIKAEAEVDTARVYKETR